MEENHLMEEVETTILTRSKCTGNNCIENIGKHSEYINRATEIKDDGKINFQEVLDNHFLQEETNKCRKCDEVRTITREITNSPEIMIIQTRGQQNGTKVNCEIKSQTRTAKIKVNGENVTYRIEGVIVHKGVETGNGHYVYNYIDDEGNWVQIDDHLIIRNDEVKSSNKDGTIFVLKRAETETNWSYETKSTTNQEMRSQIRNTSSNRTPENNTMKYSEVLNNPRNRTEEHRM